MQQVISSVVEQPTADRQVSCSIQDATSLETIILEKFQFSWDFSLFCPFLTLPDLPFHPLCRHFLQSFCTAMVAPSHGPAAAMRCKTNARPRDNSSVHGRHSACAWTNSGVWGSWQWFHTLSPGTSILCCPGSTARPFTAVPCPLPAAHNIVRTTQSPWSSLSVADPARGLFVVLGTV